MLVSSTESLSSGFYCAPRAWRFTETVRCVRKLNSREGQASSRPIFGLFRRGSRRIQQPDKDGIDNLGLLIFLGRIDHVVLDLHFFWKIHRDKLEYSLSTPAID